MARISFTQIVDSRFIKDSDIFLENDTENLKLKLESRVTQIKDKLKNLLMEKKDMVIAKGKNAENVFLNCGEGKIRKVIFPDKKENITQYRIDMYVETSRHINKQDIMSCVNEICPVFYNNVTKSFIEKIDTLANKKDKIEINIG